GGDRGGATAALKARAGGRGEGESPREGFEAAGRNEPPPRLDDYVSPPVAPDGLSPAVRHELLEELVKIDLEYRWRGAADPPAAASGPTLPAEAVAPPPGRPVRAPLEHYGAH